MKKIKVLIGMATALSASLILAGCSAGSVATEPVASGSLTIGGEEIASAELYGAALGEGTMVLYDNYPEGPWRALLDQFTEDTNIEVEHIRLVTPQVYERVASEAGANRLEADAIGLGDITLMQDLADRDILVSYESTVALDALTEDQYDPEFKWYSSANLVMVPAYNEKLVDVVDLPKDWNDLLSAEWNGRIGVTPIGTGGSAYSVYNLMRELHGVQYWEDFAANDPRMYESVTPLTQDLIRGEVPFAITSLGTVVSQRAEGAPINTIFFDEGTPAFSNMVGVTDQGNAPNAGRVYVNWLLSQRGQSVLVDITSEYPVRGDVDAPSVEGMDLPSADSGLIIVPGFDAWDERDARTAEWNAIFN